MDISEKETLIIKCERRFYLVDLQTIDYVEAAGNNVRVHCGADSFFVKEGLSSFFGRLPKPQFVRVSRSILLNTRSIFELRFKRPFNFEIRLHNGSTHTCTRSYRRAFCDAIGLVLDNRNVGKPRAVWKKD